VPAASPTNFLLTQAFFHALLERSFKCSARRHPPRPGCSKPPAIYFGKRASRPRVWRSCSTGRRPIAAAFITSSIVRKPCCWFYWIVTRKGCIQSSCDRPKRHSPIRWRASSPFFRATASVFWRRETGTDAPSGVWLSRSRLKTYPRTGASPPTSRRGPEPSAASWNRRATAFRPDAILTAWPSLSSPPWKAESCNPGRIAGSGRSTSR
jgi:hypothetical protein